MDVSNTLRDLSPAEIREKLADRSIMLIDVREPEEFKAEHIRGALSFPLSTFDPGALPTPDRCEVVLQCGSGKRSAMAIRRCQERGFAHNAHLAGGIQAWRAAGLPVVGPDAAGKA